MDGLFNFIGKHPIISVLLAGIIGDCVSDVVKTIFGKNQENKEEDE